MVLMWPGVPVTACASMRPRASNTPADRSPASRTTVVKEAWISAAACSSTMEISRLRSTSSVIGSIRIGSIMARLPEPLSERTSRQPPAPAATLQPGGTTVVDSASSMMAGPRAEKSAAQQMALVHRRRYEAAGTSRTAHRTAPWLRGRTRCRIGRGIVRIAIRSDTCRRSGRGPSPPRPASSPPPAARRRRAGRRTPCRPARSSAARRPAGRRPAHPAAPPP